MNIVSGYLDEAIADARALNDRLRKAIAAAKRMQDRDRPGAQDRPRRTPPRDYTRAPYIPPWAINRGAQPTYGPWSGGG